MDNRVHIHLFPGGYCGIVRVDADRVNLCIVTDRDEARTHGDCEALFTRTVWRNPFFRELGVTPEPLEPFQSAHPLWLPMNRPAADGVYLVGDALRTVEPFTGQGIFFALRTAELAASCLGDPRRYAAAVTRLYRQRGRTNDLLRGLLYHQRSAGIVMRALRRWPAGLRWFAHSVLAGQDSTTTIASS